MRITAEEIAKRCNVSRGTVDRALHGRPGVREETRQLILDTVKELDYRPHALARGLAQGRTFTLGMVTLSLRNSFIAEFIASTEMLARERGYFTYITNTDMDANAEVECIEHLVDRNVDGLILHSVNVETDYVKWLENLPVPVIAAGNRVSPNVPFVGIDDRSAARKATEYILSLGYERVAIVCPPLRYLGVTNIDAQEQRYLGFLDAMNRVCNEHDAPVVIRTKDPSPLLNFIAGNPDAKKAVFCTSDIFAIDALDILTKAGYRVPDDVGIMGFDNIETLRHIRPRITTVDQEIDVIARTVVEKLLARVEGEPIPGNTECPYRILEGSSLG